MWSPLLGLSFDLIAFAPYPELMNQIRKKSLMRSSLWVLLSSSLAFSVISCSTTSTKQLSKTERARLLVEVAGGALTEGDVVGALQHLANAEELDSQLAELHHMKALAYHAKGEPKTALQEAQKAVSISPTLSNANNTLGKLLLDDNQYTQAEHFLNQAANAPLNREAYKALTNLGILNYRRKDYAKAGKFFDRAIQASQTEACIAFYYKGHLALKEGQLKDAVIQYRHASNRLCSSFAEAHLALAKVYQRNGQFDLARRKYLEIQQQFNSTQYAQEAIDHLKNLP